MSEYLRRKMPKSYRLLATGCWHVGSKAFHEEAAHGIVGRLTKERHTYCIWMGDAVEGKMIDSPHFNPNGLTPRHLNIKAQFDYFAEIVRPARKKFVAAVEGNHDRYISRNFDTMAYMCEQLGVPRGGYQTWVDLGDVCIHAWHGRPSKPRGAKDPIQRVGNQHAWLVNRMEALAGSCHIHLMGHIHTLMVQPPIPQYALLNEGENVRARYFLEPVSEVDGARWVPPRSRWYACTGTLRRGGGFGWTDYSEIAGYNPEPIGYIEIVVRNGVIESVEKVIV